MAALAAGLNGGAAQAQACFIPSTNGPAGSQICDNSSTRTSSVATAVNADGTVVVGELLGGVDVSALWRNGVLEALAAPVGTARGRANDVSADGTVVIGIIDTNEGIRAYSSRRLPSGADEFVTLGVLVRPTLSELSGAAFSEGLGVNAAGNIVVGYSFWPGAGVHAVRWVDGVIQDLGVIGVRSTAKDVNAAGNVVVGESFDGSVWQSFRWVEGVGLQTLGALPGGSFSGAEAVNAAGNVVVGYSDSDAGQRAFRWIEGVGMEDLGVLPGGEGSLAYDVNADGTVVVGQSSSDDGGRAFRWVEGGTMENLGTLAGDPFSRAFGVNADGTVVVGASGGSNSSRAFIWRAAPKMGGGGTGGGGTDGGTMEDLINLTTSFPVLGNDSAVAQAEQQFAVESLMTPGTILSAGQSAMSTSAALQNTNRNPTTVGARTTSLAALGFGHGISETVTLGATLSLSGTSLKNNAFDMDAGLGLAVWGTYGASGTAGTGLQISGALGFARSEGEVARGRLLTDVVTATGQADVETRALQATLGYGLTRGDWLVTPELGLTRYDTTRAAYNETGAAFNASYDAMVTSRTVATLSVTGEMAWGERGRLSLGLGVDREVNPERPRLTGRSDLPGLATFDIESSFTANSTRVFATVGYAHDLGDGASIAADLRVGEAVYGTSPSVGVGVTYAIRF